VYGYMRVFVCITFACGCLFVLLFVCVNVCVYQKTNRMSRLSQDLEMCAMVSVCVCMCVYVCAMMSVCVCAMGECVFMCS